MFLEIGLGFVAIWLISASERKLRQNTKAKAEEALFIKDRIKAIYVPNKVLCLIIEQIEIKLG